MKTIAAFITENSEANQSLEEHNQLMELLAHKRTALLVSERMINLPPQLVPPLYENLLEDLKWTLQQPDVEKVESYMFEYVLVITRGFRYNIT